MNLREVVVSQQVRYVVAGAWNTLFGLATFSALFLAFGNRLGYAWILLAAQVIATLQAHYAQRRFVWASDGAYFPELMRFSIVYVLSYAINLAALAFLVEVLQWEVIPAQALITVIIVAATFAINRTWTFRGRGGPSANGARPTGVERPSG